jgi:hypothetical protein
VIFAQVDSCFAGAVAQLVEHLLCKKNAQSAVLGFDFALDVLSEN